MNLEELELYGSSRLGVKQVSQQMSALSFTSETGNNYRVLGLKQYELSNHLGNVLSVISDQKLPQFNAGTLQAYKPVIVSSQDYYLFGMVMKERSSNLASDGYRFGFNNQERTDEISGAGNHTTALFWEYDTRIGRRWNLDPSNKSEESPYNCLGNSPITSSDLNGDFEWRFWESREVKQARKFARLTGGNFHKTDKEYRKRFGVSAYVDLVYTDKKDGSTIHTLTYNNLKYEYYKNTEQSYKMNQELSGEDLEKIARVEFK